MENRFQKSARARSKHRGNSGAALVSIKPCLLMFLLAEARFGNMDHNTIFIPYKIHCEVMRSGNCWAAPGRSFRKEGALSVRVFTAHRAILFLLWKKNWEASKAYVSQISKKWKTRFQEEKCENRSSGRASCVSHTGDRWGRDQPRTCAAFPSCLPHNWS